MGTQTCTVVFVDLAGTAEIAGQVDQEGQRGRTAAHGRMVTPMLEQHGGQVLKNIGDSFLAIFPSATDAVRAGVELVERLPVEEGLRVRAGMATGDVELMGGDAFGEVVNLASRIQHRVPSGQIWLSQATLLCMNQAEIAWEAVGLHQLKGIAGEAEVFRAVPRTQVWLPEPVGQAHRAGRLVRYQRGVPLSRLPPQPTILLEGFLPGSTLLEDAVASLPVVDPASLWLVAYTIAPSDRLRWQRSGRGLVISTPEALDRAMTESRRRTSSVDSITYFMDNSTAELVLAGLALPAVPLVEVVAGYSYDLLADGRWVSSSDQAVARVEVQAEGTSLSARVTGIQIGGQPLPPGSAVRLSDGDVIAVPSGELTFRIPGSTKYAGLLLGDSQIRMGIASGQRAEIGREPNHPGLALPDRRGQDNIRWCAGYRATRARESGFTVDRSMAGRRQAVIHLDAEQVLLVNLHERCPTYVLEEGALVQVHEQHPIDMGTIIVVGTSVVALREPS